MHNPYLKRSQPVVYNLYSLWAACCWWLVHSCCDKKRSKVPHVLKLEPSLLRLPMLHSGSSPALPFTYLMRMFNFRELFKRAFKIYGIWPQANKHITNTLPQCSPASVGLAQAHPNYAPLMVGWEDKLNTIVQVRPDKDPHSSSCTSLILLPGRQNTNPHTEKYFTYMYLTSNKSPITQLEVPCLDTAITRMAHRHTVLLTHSSTFRTLPCRRNVPCDG